MKKEMFGILVGCILLVTVMPALSAADVHDEALLPSTSISISTPQEGNLYAMGAQLFRLPFNWTVILGPITVRADVTGINGFVVNFYIDDELKSSDSSPPFEYPWWDISFGRHVIKAELEGYGLEDTVQVFKIF
ncbi:MAG TPA: hypothetical protein ENI42_07105 [Thermoplasmatales archaeon]|nr:hypothetical protein [Thermoplasmatales archaeon]